MCSIHICLGDVPCLETEYSRVNSDYNHHYIPSAHFAHNRKLCSFC